MIRFLLLPAVLACPVLAQKVNLDLKPQGDQTQRISIQTSIQTTDARKTLINGEEGGFGGRGGGGGAGGETSISQEVVFDQGPANANWRQYHKVTSTETRPGRDGDPQETKTEGALQGKKVRLEEGDDGNLALVEGEGDKAKAVPAMLSRNVPGRVSLLGFLPKAEVAVDEEFDLGKSFLPAVRGLIHPVAAERPAAAGGRGQGGRGEGGQGGRGGRGEGGQGGGGQGFAGRGGRGAGSAVLDLLGGKLDVAATGKVVSVEKQDGAEIAVLEIKATLTGKGAAEALGLRPAMGGFGGRGGQGGQGGQGGGGTDNVDATIEITGRVRVDLTQQTVAAVELDGSLKIARKTKNSMDRGGEAMEIESTTDTKGKFRLAAHCEASK